MSSPHQDDDRSDERGSLPIGWFRWYAFVLEFLAYIGVLGYAGWWLDDRYGWQPWGFLAGLLLGLTVGLYRMIRESKRSGL